MARKKDLTGKTFGRLTVIRENGRKWGYVVWLCSCECGNEATITGSQLTRGKALSCGCMRLINAAKTNRKHGMLNTPIYHSWKGMKARCNNKKDPFWHIYGGRGLTYCKRWESFENFYADMGDKPGSEYSLDRIDNNKGYSPNNCRWATDIEQGNNKRVNRSYEYKGETLTIAELARKYRIKYSNVLYRLDNGWDIETALSEKVSKGNRYAR